MSAKRKRGRPPKTKRPGPGRPKRRPESGQSLRAKAAAAVESSQARRNTEDAPAPVLIEDVVEEVCAITTKHRYTADEIKELRAKVEMLYQEHLTRQATEKYEANKEQREEERLAAIEKGFKKNSTDCMSPEEWNLLHGKRFDGTKKRGPKPKPKMKFYEVTPGKWGTANEKHPSVNIDELEREVEEQMMEERIEQQKEEDQFLKGARFRQEIQRRPSAQQPKNFWY